MSRSARRVVVSCPVCVELTLTSLEPFIYLNKSNIFKKYQYLIWKYRTITHFRFTYYEDIPSLTILQCDIEEQSTQQREKADLDISLEIPQSHFILYFIAVLLIHRSATRTDRGLHTRQAISHCVPHRERDGPRTEYAYLRIPSSSQTRVVITSS